MALNHAMPEFNKPPVSEVAISVAFTPLKNWSSSHALLFGSMINNEYPKMELQAPIISEEEKFGEEFWQQGQLRFEYMSENTNRFWFMTEPSNWLVQVQNDRFILNWRRISEGDEYPRYDAVIRGRFLKEINRFLKFILDKNIGEINVTQCEVTYVNDIVQGEYWETVSDAIDLFSILAKNESGKFLEDIETIAVTGSYAMPDEKGRLRFSINHAIRNTDKKELMKLSLIARGRPDASDIDTILNWIDLGREWIVRGFEDMTTKKAHALWRKED
jgi:uncharacterized protein (TIGR04255 family)